MLQKHLIAVKDPAIALAWYKDTLDEEIKLIGGQSKLVGVFSGQGEMVVERSEDRLHTDLGVLPTAAILIRIPHVLNRANN